MRRITTEEAVEDFRVTGLRPVRGDFGSIGGLANCGCILTAKGLREHGDEKTHEALEGDPYHALADLIGLSREYASGIADGWDGESPGASQQSEFGDRGYEEGYADGLACWLAVDEEFGITKKDD